MRNGVIADDESRRVVPGGGVLHRGLLSTVMMLRRRAAPSHDGGLAKGGGSPMLHSSQRQDGLHARVATEGGPADGAGRAGTKSRLSGPTHAG